MVLQYVTQGTLRAVPVRLVRTQAELVAALAVGGDIRVDSSVTIALSAQMNVTLPTRITGGTFTRTTGAAFYITSSDVLLDSVKITGGGGSAYDSTQKLIYAKGTSGVPLKNVRICGCDLRSSRGDNVWLEWCTDSAVESNYMATFLYSGVLVLSGKRVLVANNVIRDSPLSAGVTNVYGIAVTDLDNTLAARSVDCTIVGNQISLIDWEGIDTHGGDGLTVVGNTVTACPRGIALVVGNETRVAAPTRCTVAGNTVNGAGVRQAIREGIFLGGIAGVPADGTVTGNHVTNHSPTFSSSYVARDKLLIAANNEAFVPWTDITMDADYNPNGTYAPQFMVDGNTTYMRGGVIPKTGAVRTNVGHLGSAFAWPVVLSFIGLVKGSNAAAGNGMLACDTAGLLQFLYTTGSDTYTYFLYGSFQNA